MGKVLSWAEEERRKVGYWVMGLGSEGVLGWDA